MHFKKWIAIQVSLVTICFTKSLLAQGELNEIYEYDLSQLSKLKIVSATKVEQNLSEVPSSVFVISKEQIAENGYLTIDEILSDLPGFQFRNPLGFNSYIFQRGVPNQNNYTLVLIDGVQVNELNSGGFYAGGLYNLSNVERIEVIQGPSSVAYGTNAISGIINIITKNPVQNETELGALAGSFSTYNGDFCTSFLNSDKTIGVSISGMAKTSEKANLKGEEGDNNWTSQMENFENDFAFDLKVTAKSFVLGTNLLQKQSSTTTFNRSIGSIYRDHGTLWNIRFVNSYLKYNKPITEKFSLNFTLYNRNSTVLPNTIRFVTDTAQIGYYRPNNLTGLENIAVYRASDRFSLVSGFTLEYERLAERYSISISDSPDMKPEKPEEPTMLNNYLVSIFIQPQILLAKNLFLTGGVRFDQSSVYSQILTPRVGISYNYKSIKSRISFADAFRAPKPWDYTDGLGNEYLNPERMKSFEGATSISFNSYFVFEFIAYRNFLSEALTIEYLPNGYRWANRGKVQTDGLEIIFYQKIEKIKSQVSYTFNNSVDEFGNEVPEISKHSATASATYTLNQHFKFNLRANYYSKRLNPNFITSTNSWYIKPYMVLHGAISMIKINGFAAQLAVKNILDSEYYHTSNRDPDRYRQPQRTILLSLNYTFN